MSKKIKQKDKTKEQIHEEGIDAMVHSFMELIERVVRKRCEQIMEVVKESIQEKK